MDRLGDLVGRVDVLPVQVKPVQDQFNRIFVEVLDLLSKGRFQGLWESIDGFVEIAWTADIRHRFNNAFFQKRDKPGQKRQHQRHAKRVEHRVKDGQLQGVVLIADADQKADLVNNITQWGDANQCNRCGCNVEDQVR